MDNNEIKVYWSREDNAFIAKALQLPGCMAHGANEEDALKNLEDAIKLWIDTAIEFGDTIQETYGTSPYVCMSC